MVDLGFGWCILNCFGVFKMKERFGSVENRV
jgi:hypothetical protein